MRSSYVVQFMTLKGKFLTSHKATFADFNSALAAVRVYAAEGGYTHTKVIDEGEEGGDGFRVTARTPGGRSGRNVAYIECGVWA